MSSTTELIKERLSIADVIGSYVELARAGANFKARCPFHNEKTPSFHISPSRNAYYCFGCNAKGDIFTFVEQFEGLDFNGALKVLAERAGVPIKAENRAVRDKRERLFAVLESATAFFEKELAGNETVRRYIADRGISEDSSRSFRLGFAPDTWRSVSSFLLAQGFTEDELFDAGLIKRSAKGHYDRFRGRVMFPLADSSGRIVAFSGRILPGHESFTKEVTVEVVGDGEVAKYLNSPETPVFSKSTVLYGFDKAKLHIRQKQAALVVEGQMDLVLAHQAGFSHAVALSGTALSAHQVALVKRLTPAIVLALDADEAGTRAMGRSATAALQHGVEPRVARLPVGSDPADLIKKDPEAFIHLVNDAKHVIEFYLDILSEQGHDERTYRLEVARIVLPLIGLLDNAILRAHFIGLTARRIRLGEEHLWQELARIPTATPVPPRMSTVPPRKTIAGRRASLEEALRGIVVWQNALSESPVLAHIRERMSEIVGTPDTERFFTETQTVGGEATSFEAELLYGDKDLIQTVDEILDTLKTEVLREQYAIAVEELARAEAEHNETMRREALQKCHELSRRLGSVRAET